MRPNRAVGPWLGLAAVATGVWPAGGQATPSPTPSNCDAIAVCNGDPNCAACLKMLSPFRLPPETTPAFLSEQEGEFYTVLLATPACGRTALIYPALAAFKNCSTINFSTCQLRQFTCSQNRTCAECLGAVYSMPSTRAAYSTPACLNTPYTELEFLNQNCFSLPRCTWSKIQCEQTGCVSCWAALRRDDPIAAARLCAAPTLGTQMDNLVFNCDRGTGLACRYFQQRCTQHAECDGCFEAMRQGSSVAEIAAGSLDPRCDAVRTNHSLRRLIDGPFYQCPTTVYSDCEAAVYVCSILDVECARCIAGVSQNASLCPAIYLRFDVPSACVPCPEVVHEINRIVRATSVLGAVSVAACVVTILVILAHSRDRVSMRDRVVIGLMVANIMYSLANVVPMNELRTGTSSCGELATPFDDIRTARAAWFFGKYALVCFELFILGTSTWALASGLRAPPPRVEAALHLACYVGGAAALVGFYLKCAEINASGYNEATQSEAQSDAVVHLSPSDDADDDTVGIAASRRFDAGRKAYDALVQQMLQVWIGFLVLAVLSWAHLRRSYARLLARSHALAQHTTASEAADAWAQTRRAEWRAMCDVARLQCEAYAGVARPLEPYVWVLIAFGVPACVMATDWCENRSTAQAGSVAAAGNDPNITYQTCDVWCELALAFRSLAVVVVYFLPRERRAELINVRKTGGLLLARCLRCCGRGSGDKGDEVELVTLSERSPGVRLTEADFVLETRLAEGTYGVVWSASAPWAATGRVAVKMLKTGEVDAEGDPVDPFAEEDFRKECEVLARLDHPHLLKLYGFGTTSQGGRGFIVTELCVGSLRVALRDPNWLLDWATRLRIAGQLADAMAYLHRPPIPIVHRDFKSANVLLDAGNNAKVGDFGTSRLFEARQARVVVSGFTGAVLSEPSPAGGDLLLGQKGLRAGPSRTPHLEAVADGRGTMTKAVGTLLWMAPEVYRGDVHYGPAVDVYSFGMVCWELATDGATPWDDLGEDLSYVELLKRLTHALQTGRRPVIPAGVTAEHPLFVEVIERCWAGDPADRPPFSEIVALVAAATGTPAKAGMGPEKGKVEPNLNEGEGLTEPLLAAPW